MAAFKNQVALVTGGGSGIGKAIAMRLAEEGATVYIVGRHLEKLELVASIVRAAARQVRIHQADLVSEQNVQELVKRVERDFGHLDILVHSAGVISLSRIEDAEISDFDLQYKVNVRAPYVLTQGLLSMLKSRQGQIVFINSSVGISAREGSGQYAATKHALKAVADSLRQEVNADGMRVLSVFLGRTSSPMQAAVHEQEGRPYHPERLLQPEDVATLITGALSLPRTAEVTDINIRNCKKQE